MAEPELRKVPLLDRWVLLAPDRAARPIELTDRPGHVGSGFDPFAEGHEDATPPEVLALRDPGSAPNGPGWRVRVVPNQFPALVSQVDPRPLVNDFYESATGFGVHEVVVECPHMETSLARLPVEQVRNVLDVYRQRLLQLRGDSRLAHATVFKNQGAAAGASLEHCHSQILATPMVPATVRQELDGARAYYESHGRSVFEELLARELSVEERLLHVSGNFVALCPFASRFPFEVCILPRRGGSHYEQLSPESLADLADVLLRTLSSLDRALNDPPYNCVLHSAPFHGEPLPYFSWHFEILPRIAGLGGYELGTGYHINAIPPEDAARMLREA